MASKKQEKVKRVEKREKEDILYKFHEKAYKPIRSQDYADDKGVIDGNKLSEDIRERKNNRRYLNIAANSGDPFSAIKSEAYDISQEAIKAVADLHGNEVTIGKGGQKFRSIGEALADYQARNKKSFFDNLATRVTGSSADLLAKRMEEEREYAKRRKAHRDQMLKSDENYKDYTGKRGSGLFDAAFSDYMTRKMTEAAEKRSKIGNLAGGQQLPGGRIAGVNYDSFGQPVRPRKRSYYGGMTSRQIARVREEEEIAMDNYAAAQTIWARDNPRIAGSGVSAAQWYRSEFAGSDEYKTIKAQTRLNNAAAAAERDRMNRIASQMEGARELERNGYTFDKKTNKWSAPGTQPSSNNSTLDLEAAQKAVNEGRRVMNNVVGGVKAAVDLAKNAWNKWTKNSNPDENKDPMDQRAGYSGGKG